MNNILVATDGSVMSSRALGKAIELARQSGARLTIVNVLDILPVGPSFRRFAQTELRGGTATTLAPMPIRLPGTLGLDTTESLETLDQQSRAVAQLVSDRVLLEAKAVAEAAGLTGVETVSADGDPAQQIVATARSIGADLVVVGRRGLGGLDEILLGSVSQKVLHRSPTDVYIAA
ncbi:MAG: universal stress protein [Devosia sp.]|uniref:universal stress protein n=1 Tax=Devosia sp. TaxID=1871048 RepID=UPI001ACDDEB0|nr:universal stress protein [Devosia sp.]MBN9316754.1 universal stress protein [Devosia sp.]